MTRSLPARARLLLRGGYVMTMDQAGDLPGADVLVSDGCIVAIGSNLSEVGAEVIDAQGFIVMPGLVDTHWHMWTTLMRNLGGRGPSEGYFWMTAKASTAFQPADMYVAVLLSAAEALKNGITTVHDWCHNIQSFDMRRLTCGRSPRRDFVAGSPTVPPGPRPQRGQTTSRA